MHVELKRQGEGFYMEAAGDSGISVPIDASAAIGGTDRGVRPMEMLLIGLAGCSSIDVVSILKKQRIDPGPFRVLIDAEREADAVPSLFQKIHVRFVFKKSGEIDQDKLKRAIDLSLEKYCSVAKTLEKTAKITYDYTIEE
jgi:putative redox protein